MTERAYNCHNGEYMEEKGVECDIAGANHHAEGNDKLGYREVVEGLNWSLEVSFAPAPFITMSVPVSSVSSVYHLGGLGIWGG